VCVWMVWCGWRGKWEWNLLDATLDKTSLQTSTFGADSRIEGDSQGSRAFAFFGDKMKRGCLDGDGICNTSIVNEVKGEAA
jgi:hypothetical protein